MFLLEVYEDTAFTINQHYLTHVTEMIRQLGPLRCSSARVLERTIGNVKRLIRSRSKPAENAVTVMKNHHSLACRAWGVEELQVNKKEIMTITELFTTSSQEEVEAMMYKFPYLSNQDNINYYPTCCIPRTKQLLSHKRKTKRSVVVEFKNEDGRVEHATGIISTAFSLDGSILYAMVTLEAMLLHNGSNYYMNRSNVLSSVYIAAIDDIVGLTIYIPSIMNDDIVHVMCKGLQ